MTHWARVSAFGLLGLVSAGSVEAQQPSNTGSVEVQVGRPRTLPGERPQGVQAPGVVVGANQFAGGSNLAQYEGLKRAISASQLYWASQQAGGQSNQGYYRQLRQQAQRQAQQSLEMISGAEQDAQQAVTNPQFVQAAQRYRQILFNLCGIPGGTGGNGAGSGRSKFSAEDFAKVTLINAAVCQAVESAEWAHNPQIARYYPASNATEWNTTLAAFLQGQPAAGAVGANDPGPNATGGMSSVEQLAQQAQMLIATLRSNGAPAPAPAPAETGRPIR